MNENSVTRRGFIQTGAATCAAVASGIWPSSSRGQSGSKNRWQMRLSCSSINFSSLPIEQAVERIAGLGFDAIDIWSAHAGCPHLDDVLERLGPNGLKELLKKNRLELYSFAVYSGGYPRYAKLLGEAGGGVAVRGSTRTGKSSELVPLMKQFLESLKPELELAEKYNSYLAIENHGGALLNSIDSFQAFVDLNSHPRLGIALAPYHIQQHEGSVEDAIRICGKQLFFFYAWQQGKGTAQLPGHGSNDCTPWIASLARIGFRWPVNPFMHHEPEPNEMSKAMAKSRKYLQACYAKAMQTT